jgi:hypothetical protein
MAGRVFLSSEVATRIERLKFLWKRCRDGYGCMHVFSRLIAPAVATVKRSCMLLQSEPRIQMALCRSSQRQLLATTHRALACTESINCRRHVQKGRKERWALFWTMYRTFKRQVCWSFAVVRPVLLWTCIVTPRQ